MSIFLPTTWPPILWWLTEPFPSTIFSFLIPNSSWGLITVSCSIVGESTVLGLAAILWWLSEVVAFVFEILYFWGVDFGWLLKETVEGLLKFLLPNPEMLLVVIGDGTREKTFKRIRLFFIRRVCLEL